MDGTRESVTFGFIVPQRGAMFGLGSTKDILQLGVEAERAGTFDTLWLGDSLSSKHRPEAIACAGALAGTTTRVRLAVGCMASMAVRDPALLALQWATLDQISGGRMLLAACTGLQPGGASAHEGENFGGVRDVDRAARMEEAIQVCRQLWSGEQTDIAGRFFQYRDLQILPAPVQDPCPVWISANPRPNKYLYRIMRRIATVADGWLTVYPGHDEFAELRRRLDEQLTAAGREAGTFPIGLYHNINIGPDRDSCLAETKRFADNYYGPGFLDAMIPTMTVAGPASDCIEQLLALAAEGVGHISLRITSFAQGEQLKILAEQVLPEVITQIGKQG